MESFNIAVIGATGVGKSSFVQRVLGLSRPSMSNASTVRMVVDNVTHGITLLELDLEYFELTPTAPIQWPKQVNGHIVPRVDAALLIYDVMNKESIRDLPQTLAALTNSNLPAILVANKCEQPDDEWEVDADDIANHEYFESCIAKYMVSGDKPDVARSCLQTIVRAAVAHRKGRTARIIK
jgi:GTPase SAR1 family protein